MYSVWYRDGGAVPWIYWFTGTLEKANEGADFERRYGREAVVLPAGQIPSN